MQARIEKRRRPLAISPGRRFTLFRFSAHSLRKIAYGCFPSLQSLRRTPFVAQKIGFDPPREKTKKKASANAEDLFLVISPGILGYITPLSQATG